MKRAEATEDEVKMASIVEANKFRYAGCVTQAAGNTRERYQEIYEAHQDRIYSLSFYMTDSEPAAEELARNVFCRAFAKAAEPATETIDRALVAELRELMSLGTLTLPAAEQPANAIARTNVKRVVLERAVVSLPATERLVFLLHDVESYGHERIGQLLGISLRESQQALHLARLSVRQWVATHND